jgi:hypothetical protein
MSYVLETIDQRPGLRLEFVRRGDRYHHALDVWCHDRWQRVLQSHEDDGQQAWPPSPPLQQLTIENRGEDCSVALAVGMAGASHWSLSAALHRAERRLEFDVACRCQTSPAWLGSSYGVSLFPCTVGHDRLSVQLNKVILELVAATPCSRLSGTGPKSFLAVQPQVVAAAGTVRWRYTVVVRSNGD